MQVTYKENTTAEVILIKKTPNFIKVLDLGHGVDNSLLFGVINTNKISKNRFKVGAFLYFDLHNCNHQINRGKVVYLKGITNRPGMYYIQLSIKEPGIESCSEKYLFGEVYFDYGISVFEKVFITDYSRREETDS